MIETINLMSLSKKKFDKEGFCVVDNIVDKKIFDQIKLEIASLIAAVLAPSQELQEFNTFNEILSLCNDLDSSTRSLIYSRLQQLPSLLSVPSSNSIKNIASTLLCQNSNYIGVWPRVQLRFDLPMIEETEILWHTDYIYNKGTKNSLTFWIPICDYETDMGGICYIPGSHLFVDDFSFAPNKESKSRHNYDLSPSQLSGHEIVNVLGRENQGVLFDSQLVHSGILNKGSFPRATILFRMQDLTTLEV